jgi:5-methylthioadenosine/S-adenosylhomocysteine deaminase
MGVMIRMSLDEMVMREKLIKNVTAYVGKEFDRRDGVDVYIVEDRIKQIGKGLKKKDAEIIDGSDFFMTPGFVNAHFHPTQQLNRALGVGLSHDQQMDLLHATDRIKRSDDKQIMSYLAVLEGLKSGTTCFYSVGSDIEFQMKPYNEIGIRAACLLMPKDIAAVNKGKKVAAKIWDTAERIAEAERLHKKYHSDVVRVHFGVVNVRYASDKLILGMQELAEKYDVYFHMHAAEGDVYVDAVKERTGDRPVEHLHKIGALNHRVSLAHMTKLTNKEIGYLAEAGSHVVHCPRANSYVSVGVCPVVDLMNAGINVCLGSDAAINNNSNEVRGEVSAAFNKISDKYGKANMIDHRELFRMLTLNGAKAMGLENEIGTIEEGKNADLVLWSKNDTPFIPGFNYLADLIFTEGGNAHTVLINGDIVLQNYKSVKVDEIELVKKARKVSDRYHKAFNDEVAGHLR